MHGLMLVAFFSAALAIFSLLNMGAWAQLSESKTEQLASQMLVEHFCKYSPSTCPGEHDRSGFFGFNEGPGHRCTYTTAPYEKKSPFFSVLASKTNHSYLCLGQKAGGVFKTAPEGYRSEVGCLRIGSISPDRVAAAPEAAVVLCESKR